MKVLFIGGTGTISSACTRLAVKNELDLYVLNRGKTLYEYPNETHVLHGDIRDKEQIKGVLKGMSFDVVVDWIAYNPEHIETDLELFRHRTSQYIFISTASAYQKPPLRLPITESTPLANPFWEYSRLKIACEERLQKAYRQEQFPITIVRPSHTYDHTRLPVQGRYTVIDRMRRGKKVIVHGDGTSLWFLTHHEDFARGFIGLLGNQQAIGEAYHITTDEVLTWNQIYEILARAARASLNMVHIPSDYIASFDPDWGEHLLGDKTYSVIFDNTKIKRVVPGFTATIPYSQGAEETLAWFDADPARRKVDARFDQLMDRIIVAYESSFPKG